MATSRKTGQKSTFRGHHTLIRRCMAIILKSLDNSDTGRLTFSKPKGTSSLEGQRGLEEGPGPPPRFENTLGLNLFKDMVEQNSECYWNPSLVQSVCDLEYKGCLVPTTLLVSGSEFSLEVVRSAWARRMLKPPTGYDVWMLGDLDPVQMTVVSQTQFAPLPEALCKVVYDLNTEGVIANMELIGVRLRSTFPEISLPNQNVLYRALGSLIRERKLYHTGNGYSVVTPDTFRLLAMSPPLERQMLLTNDEAIVRLHGAVVIDGQSACTQTNQRDRGSLTTWSSAERIVSPRLTNSKLKRCHSLKLLRGRDKEKLTRSNSFRSTRASPVQTTREAKSDAENVDPNKKEKASVFSKLFRRGRTKNVVPKSATFSSQFPPRDRSDPDFVHFNSRATQTSEKDDTNTRRNTKARSRSLNRMTYRERHTQLLSSISGTTKNKSNTFPATDMYHCRSSSVPRKSSPSPKPETSRSIIAINGCTSPKNKYIPKQNIPPKTQKPNNSSQVPTWASPKPVYPTSFLSPISKPCAAPSTDTSQISQEKPNGVVPNGTLWSIKPFSTSSTASPSSVNPPKIYGYYNGYPWRSLTNPTPSFSKNNIVEPKKPIAVVGVPQRIVPREVTPIVIPKAVTPTTTKSQVTKTVTENIVTTETTTTQKKGLEMEGSVDVQINVGPLLSKSGIDGDHSMNTSTPKNDLLKIAASWNHSVSNKLKTSKMVDTNNAGMNNPTLTTTTSITTSVTHPSMKDTSKPTTLVKCGDQESQSMKNSINNSSETNRPLQKTESTLMASRTKLAEAKRDFFCESPSPTEPVSLKDDSGFSSSASTSRPMSVSPC